MNDPEQIIEAQKEQISRYQSRLKDVVSAYKSLLKEKEALDVSLTALTKDGNESSSTSSEVAEKTKQLNAVVGSLATLSSEKCRMEASFQADKKNMRLEMSAKDKEIKELQEKLKAAVTGLNNEKEKYKAKLISYDRMLSDERHLKENLETQLNQLKTQFSQTSNSDKVIRDLNQELSEAKRKLKAYESNQLRSEEDSTVLSALQTEMENLKHQHILNLSSEKQRANEANEKSRKLLALHEEKVQSLEARLSELSESVAQYHNLRESDQKSILSLKETISQFNQNREAPQENSQKLANVHSIIDEIGRLKHLLIFENTKLDQPLDLSFILSHSPTDENVSAEMFAAAKQECAKLRKENESMQLQLSEQTLSLKTLQEKVQVLNKNIDEYETEIKNKSSEIQNQLKHERAKWKDTISSMESEFRSKTSQLEQQLQKQRERSLHMLEEKENEIRTLKTSYELFLPKKSTSSNHEEDDGQKSDSSSTRKTSVSQLGIILNQAPNSTSNLPETHMIYYSNELARKEMELASLRKSKREADGLIRQTLKEKIMLQEEMDDKIMNLEQQVDRLERTKSREGANLEYLKNVTLSYLTSSDSHSKKKMLNAIGAVLRFDDNEIGLINNHGSKKK